MKSSIILLAFCVLGSACKVNEGSDNSKPFYISSFISKWSSSTNDYEFSFNETKDLVLCVRFDLENPKSFDYSIYDRESEVEIHTSGFIGSGVSWLNDFEIVINGTSRVDINHALIVNVLTKESRILSENILKEKKK